MKKYCLVNTVREEKLREYAEDHRNMGGPVLRALKESGAEEECVFLCGNMAVICIKCEDINDFMFRFYRTPEGAGWGRRMQPYLSGSQCMNDDGTVKEKAEYLEKVFDLDEQLEKEEDRNGKDKPRARD